MLLAAAAAIAGAACGARPDEPPLPTFHDRFDVGPAGPLQGRRAQSGQPWIARTATAEYDLPVVDGGHLGPGPGAAAAGYAVGDLGRPASRVGAEFRWDRAQSPTSALALGAFTWPASGLERQRPGPPDAGSSMHFSLSPTTAAFAVFSHGIRPPQGDFTLLAADGHASPSVVLRRPMVCDGRTTYRVDLRRDGDTVVVELGDEPPITYRHPLIATLPARYAFWEHFLVPGGTNRPRFSRVWAA